MYKTYKIFALFGLLSVLALKGFALPENVKLYETEEYFSKDRNFRIISCIHVSGGKYVEAKKGNTIDGAAMLMQSGFPEDGKTYTIWARAKQINLGVKGPFMRLKTFKTASKDWKWHKLGRFSAKKIGSSFSIFAVSDKSKKIDSAALDSILLAADDSFKPAGIYQSALGPQGKLSRKSKGAGGAVLQDIVQIYPKKVIGKVSTYIASANAHGAKRHVLDNKQWDDTMKCFFSGNILVLLHSAFKKPNKDGNYWDFKQFDDFIIAAKKKWQVKDVMILPQWWLRWKNKDGGPTEEEMRKGREIMMQLVRRYGKKGPLYVKYWVLSDEWPCGGYWRKNYKQFAAYYASIVNEVKKFNPQLKVGGPVDCWPNDKIIAELLRVCPKLDFIAWNMFITGRADTPLPDLFKRTAYLKVNVKSSRELSRKILGKELPVMVSSYGPNYHAWSPPDFKLAQPICGVWNVLALNLMIEAKCFSGVFYNVVAKDCGLFGPNDPFAAKANMLPTTIDPALVNIRPLARVHYFYKKNIAGNQLCKINVKGNKDKLNIIATRDKQENLNIAMVNYSEQGRLVTLKIDSFVMPDYDGFGLPSSYLYCDKFSVRSGQGFFFCAKGQSKIYMPPFSSYCIKTKCLKSNVPKDAAAMFHMDGRYFDQCKSGSKSLGWYGNHFTRKIKKTGSGAVDCVGQNKRGRLKLAGDADINGRKKFGISFWVYRIKNTHDFGSIISFGNKKFEIEHVGGGNPDDRFQVLNAGFCKFGGTWKHNVRIPVKKWTNIAITADGKKGRIIINGKQEYAFRQTGKGLNGGNILYLGAQQANTGIIDCYIDELVISAKACGKDWAKKIFEATKDGNNYVP